MNVKTGLSLVKRMSILAIALIGLSACGGGGESDASPTPSTPPPPPPAVVAMPRISASIVTFSGQDGTQVKVEVVDPVSFVPVTNATVTVNGAPLPYVAADAAFASTMNLGGATQATISVSNGARVFTRTVALFASGPVVTDPVPGQVWDTFNPVTLRWSSSTTRDSASYQVGVLNDQRQQVWPPVGKLSVRDIAAKSLVLQGGSISYGSRIAVVGLAESYNWPEAAAESVIGVGYFTLTPFTAIPHDYSISELTFRQNFTAVEVGKSASVPVFAVKPSPREYEDASALAIWTSLDPSRVSVSSTGQLTGVSKGRAMVRANYKGLTADISVYALPPTTPSPPLPLGHSVTAQGDFGHSGFLSFGGAPQVFPPTATWSAVLDSAPSYPVVAEGKAFVTTRAGSFYALDLATGAVAWGPIKFSVVGAGGAAYDQGNVFIANSESQISSYVASTGKLNWSVKLASSSGAYTAPTVFNGVVYVEGTYATYALDARDGELLWTRGFDGVAPAVSSDGVYVLSGCDGAKLDLLRGTTIWEFKDACSGGGGRGLAIGPDGVFNPNVMPVFGGAVENIFDAATGARHVGPVSDVAPALHPNGLAYVLKYPVLSAVQPRSSATPVWTFSGDGTLVTKPFLVDSTVFVGGTSGAVYALDAATGALKWSGNAGAPLDYTDEHLAPPLKGFGAGEGWVLVPAGNALRAWKVSSP